MLCPVQIPSREFPVLELISASNHYRGLVKGWGKSGGVEGWRGGEGTREHSDIVLVVFWQVRMYVLQVCILLSHPELDRT